MRAMGSILGTVIAGEVSSVTTCGNRGVAVPFCTWRVSNARHSVRFGRPFAVKDEYKGTWLDETDWCMIPSTPRIARCSQRLGKGAS